MKYLILIIFLACVFCPSVLMRSAGSVKENALDNTLRIDVPGPIRSLHAVEGQESASTAVFPLIYDYLFVPGQDGPLEPDLAGSWSYDSGSFTWTIRLINGARFHDGTPVRPADVRHSFMEILGKQRPAHYFSIREIHVARDDTIQIVLRHDDPQFLTRLKGLCAEIFPESPGNTADAPIFPAGSGPFRVAYHLGEQEVGLVANENYFGERPAFDRITFRYEPDVEKSWRRLLRGETDVVSRMAPKDYKAIREHEDLFHFSISTSSQYALSFSTIPGTPSLPIRGSAWPSPWQWTGSSLYAIFGKGLE